MRTALELWARPHRNLSDELDAWLQEWVSSPTWAATERHQATTLRPAYDFEETDTHYLLSLDLPGVRKEDLQIQVTADTLTIEGEKKPEARRVGGNRSYSERSFGKFSRQFQFPVAVNADNVEAEYDNGVLRIALAKERSAQPRRVEIKGEAHKPGLFEKLLGKSEPKV